MHSRTAIAACLALFLPVAAAAASPFDGTWKEDLATTTSPSKPNVYQLKGGVFTDVSAVPRYSVKTDGAYHAVKGIPYVDTLSVTITGDHAVTIIGKKADKTVAEIDFVVAPDGKTMTQTFSNTIFTSPMKGSVSFVRVGAGAAGSHALAGSWRQDKLAALSDSALVETLTVADNTLTVGSPLGTGFAAKIGGGEASYHGDPGITSASVRQIGASSLLETDKRNGKVVGTIKRTVSADGATLNYVYTDMLAHASNRWTARKQ